MSIVKLRVSGFTGRGARLDTQVDGRSGVCCTIHGGLTNAFLSVLGREKRSLPTGGSSHDNVKTDG